MIKAGMLAIIVGSKQGNDGKIVHVDYYVGENFMWKGSRWNGGKKSWMCTSLGAPFVSDRGRVQPQGPIPERLLKPLTPLTEEPTVEQKETNLP